MSTNVVDLTQVNNDKVFDLNDSDAMNAVPPTPSSLEGEPVLASTEVVPPPELEPTPEILTAAPPAPVADTTDKDDPPVVIDTPYVSTNESQTIKKPAQKVSTISPEATNLTVYGHNKEKDFIGGVTAIHDPR